MTAIKQISKNRCLSLVLVLVAIGGCYRSLSQTVELSPNATYYQMDINTFDDFTNGVWSDVYNWDPARDYVDKKSGNVVGGWKALEWDNLYLEHYTEYGGYWEGWCPSNRDFAYEKSNPLNQFTAITKGGVDGLGTPYLIGYYGWGTDRANSCQFRMNDGVPCGVAGMYVTNLYYSYLSMKTGDGFARAFGKGDWFLLTAYGYDANNNITGTAEFYLADYRSDNQAEWHLVNDWRWFDLSSLGEVLSVEFVLSSSDNSVSGMNTPSYFCMDKLTLSLISVTKQPVSRKACVGDSVAFTAQVVGQDYFNTPRRGRPQIQWRKNGVDIPGATDTILILKNITEADSGSYACYALSDYQTDNYRKILNDPTFKAEALSEPARLQVVRPITITLQPTDTTVDENNSTFLTIATTGNNDVQYRWYKNNQAITGESNDTLFIRDASVAHTGRYYCLASSYCNSLNSQQAIVMVVPQAKPQDEATLLSLCEESVLHIAPEQSSAQHRYKWSKDGALLGNDTLSYLHKTSLQAADSGEYVCSISAVGTTIKTKRYKVSIIPRTRILSLLSSQNGLGKTLVSIEANGAELQYNWFMGSNLIASADSNSTWINRKGDYYCYISGTCGDATSGVAAITVTAIADQSRSDLPYLSANHCKTGETIGIHNAEGYAMRLVNVNGVLLVEQKNIGDNAIQLPMNYPVGIYLLQAIPQNNGSQRSLTWKLVVE